MSPSFPPRMHEVPSNWRGKLFLGPGPALLCVLLTGHGSDNPPLPWAGLRTPAMCGTHLPSQMTKEGDGYF